MNLQKSLTLNIALKILKKTNKQKYTQFVRVIFLQANVFLDDFFFLLFYFLPYP